MVPAWQPALVPGSVAAGLARETLLDACTLPGGCHPSLAPLQVTCQGWQYFVGALPTGWSGTLPGVFCDVRTYHCSAHCVACPGCSPPFTTPRGGDCCSPTGSSGAWVLTMHIAAHKSIEPRMLTVLLLVLPGRVAHSDQQMLQSAAAPVMPGLQTHSHIGGELKGLKQAPVAQQDQEVVLNQPAGRRHETGSGGGRLLAIILLNRCRGRQGGSSTRRDRHRMAPPLRQGHAGPAPDLTPNPQVAQLPPEL